MFLTQMVSLLRENLFFYSNFQNKDWLQLIVKAQFHSSKHVPNISEWKQVTLEVDNEAHLDNEQSDKTINI